MYIQMSLDQVPPTVDLCEQEDFTSFRVVVISPSHAWVEPEFLLRLAGSPDHAWKESLSAMVAYASSKGWVDEAGRIRGHVDVERPD